MSLPNLSSAGKDVTVVGYGAQIQVLRKACDMAQKELGVSCELIDLRTIIPWDVDTVAEVCVCVRFAYTGRVTIENAWTFLFSYLMCIDPYPSQKPVCSYKRLFGFVV